MRTSTAARTSRWNSTGRKGYFSIRKDAICSARPMALPTALRAGTASAGPATAGGGWRGLWERATAWVFFLGSEMNEGHGFLGRDPITKLPAGALLRQAPR